MEIPRAILPEDDSMPPPARMRTQPVTGDSLNATTAPATATLDASNTPPPPVSEADFDASKSSAAAAAHTTSVAVAHTTSVAVVSASSPWTTPDPSRQLVRPQTYREFYDETSNSLAAVFASLGDESDSEATTPPPPPPLAEALPGTSTNNSRSVASGISKSRSKVPPGGLSGLVFSEAVHRMLKHLALTQMFVTTEWLTLLQIFTENGGNGPSRFYDVRTITIIRDYAIVSPDHQPDIWFSLRDNHSRRALEYFIRLSTRYAWWTCKFVNVLQTPTPRAAEAISRMLRRLRPSLDGVTFPQTHDFWYRPPNAPPSNNISKKFTWLRINQPARQYVRGIYCHANHLIQPNYWTQSRLVRVYFNGCSSYACPRADVHLAVFSFYRELPPRPEPTKTDDPPKSTQFQHPAYATTNDHILQAIIAWPSNFFVFWKEFGTHYSALDIRVTAQCFPTPSPRDFILTLMPRIRHWSGLRQVRIKLRYANEAHPGCDLPLHEQAIEFAVETNIRCQDLRGALFDEQPPLPSEISLIAEYDCWHATAAELQQTAYAFRRTFEAPQQQVWITQRCDASYVIGTSWVGHNYRLALRIFLRAIGIGYTLPKPPSNYEARRKALRTRLQKIMEQDAHNA